MIRRNGGNRTSRCAAPPARARASLARTAFADVARPDPAGHKRMAIARSTATATRPGTGLREASVITVTDPIIAPAAADRDRLLTAPGADPDRAATAAVGKNHPGNKPVRSDSSRPYKCPSFPAR